MEDGGWRMGGGGWRLQGSVRVECRRNMGCACNLRRVKSRNCKLTLHFPQGEGIFTRGFTCSRYRHFAQSASGTVSMSLTRSDRDFSAMPAAMQLSGTSVRRLDTIDMLLGCRRFVDPNALEPILLTRSCLSFSLRFNSRFRV